MHLYFVLEKRYVRFNVNHQAKSLRTHPVELRNARGEVGEEGWATLFSAAKGEKLYYKGLYGEMADNREGMLQLLVDAKGIVIYLEFVKEGKLSCDIQQMHRKPAASKSVQQSNLNDPNKATVITIHMAKSRQPKAILVCQEETTVKPKRASKEEYFEKLKSQITNSELSKRVSSSSTGCSGKLETRAARGTNCIGEYTSTIGEYQAVKWEGKEYKSRINSPYETQENANFCSLNKKIEVEYEVVGNVWDIAKCEAEDKLQGPNLLRDKSSVVALGASLSSIRSMLDPETKFREIRVMSNRLPSMDFTRHNYGNPRKSWSYQVSIRESAKRLAELSKKRKVAV
uniref:Sina domain-containing protein n=1 Tax=Syphacia muris TaxID=451379 RepID=A0A158R4J1_9BILA